MFNSHHCPDTPSTVNSIDLKKQSLYIYIYIYIYISEHTIVKIN